MSKTVEQLLNEVKESESLQKDLTKALQTDKDAVVSFMRNNGCDASFDEAKSVVEEYGKRAVENGELSPEQLEEVQGGTGICLFIGVMLGSTALVGAGGHAAYKVIKHC